MPIQMLLNPPTLVIVLPGTKSPSLGSGGATWPPSGWTSLQNSSLDDSAVAAPLAVEFTIANTTYTTAYVGSNGYLTFGASSTIFNVGTSSPPYPKIFFGAGDNSFQRVGYISTTDKYTKIRYEGNGATTGTLGSPGIVVELTFFSPALTEDQQYIELLVGNHNRTSGFFGIASASENYASGNIAANQSYVFVGNSTGTTWTINTGYYCSSPFN